MLRRRRTQCRSPLPMDYTMSTRTRSTIRLVRNRHRQRQFAVAVYRRALLSVEHRLRSRPAFQAAFRAPQQGERQRAIKRETAATEPARASARARSRIASVTHASPPLRPAVNRRASARRRSTHLRRPSTIAATTRALPSGVLGPVEAPPCTRQRPFGIAQALQKKPRETLPPFRPILTGFLTRAAALALPRPISATMIAQRHCA